MWELKTVDKEIAKEAIDKAIARTVFVTEDGKSLNCWKNAYIRKIGEWKDWPGCYNIIIKNIKEYAYHEGFLSFYLLDTHTAELYCVIYLCWPAPDWKYYIERYDDWKECDIDTYIDKVTDDKYGIFIPYPDLQKPEKGYLRCYINNFAWVTPYY